MGLLVSFLSITLLIIVFLIKAGTVAFIILLIMAGFLAFIILKPGGTWRCGSNSFDGDEFSDNSSDGDSSDGGSSGD